LDQLERAAHAIARLSFWRMTRAQSEGDVFD